MRAYREHVHAATQHCCTPVRASYSRVSLRQTRVQIVETVLFLHGGSKKFNFDALALGLWSKLIRVSAIRSTLLLHENVESSLWTRTCTHAFFDTKFEKNIW